MNVLITDPALESLALYNGLSTENSRQIEKILSGLRNAQLPCRILRLSGLSRPIWHHHVDSEYSLYFAIGSGSSGPELRIFFFGITIQEDSNLYKQLVYLSGELEGPSIPDHMELLEQAQVVNWPRHPKYKLDIEDRLDDYLCKSDSATETDQARFPAPADDLNGRSFRLFTSIRSPIDLPARLSSKQREVLGKARPLLIQGIAGSGKTTLLAHFAQQESSRSEGTASILIVAYTDELKGFIVRTLHALADASPFPTIGIDVYTWREICAFIANKVGIKAIEWVPPNYMSSFLQSHLPLYCNDSSSGDIVLELKELIRSVLKGNSSNPDHALEDRAVFMGLNTLPSDKYLKRTDAFEIAESYQYAISSRGWWDDLDAARLLFCSYRDLFPQYDFVLLDEVQDYTQVELRLVASLARLPQGIVYVGDMDQVLYPSQFNWEKVRSSIWHAFHIAPREIQKLSCNYRNPRPVTEIATTLLTMRTKKCEAAFPEAPLSNQALTPIPIVLRVDSGKGLEFVRRLAESIGSLAIVDRVIHVIDIDNIRVQRCFTPQTIKGLEFNVVCLLNFNVIYKDLVANRKGRCSLHQLFLMFNEVYVSVTRTRGQLILLDDPSETTGLWDDIAFRESVLPLRSVDQAIQLIAARYSLKNRTEWRADAIGFENQGAYLAAGECWERAGEYLAAARAYELGGHMDNALKNYLALDDIDNSGRLLRALGRNREAAQLFETAARFGEAGECWAVAGNHEKAAKAYQIGGEACKDTSLWGKAGLCWTKARRSDLAAAAFVKAEQWRDAATQFRDYGDLLQAAIYFSRSGDKLQAAEFYARYYESRGDCAQAAQHWELAREDSRAADCYRMAGELTHALELLRRCHRFEDAAEISEELHDHLNAGQCWAECGNHEKAAQAYEVVAETKNEVAIWGLVAQHYAKAGRFKFSAHAYAKAGRWQDAAVQYRDCSDFLHAAEYFEKAHCWEDASTSWLKLYHPMGIHPHEQLLVGWLRRTSSAPMSENYDMRLVAMLAKVLAGHTSPDNSRTLQLADDTLRKFRAIGDLDIPPFTILCRTVSDLPGLTSNELGVLNASTSMSAAVLQECNNELHRRIAEFQQSLPRSNFTSTSARENEAVIQCAQVLEICHELTDAYNLYLRAGDKESSARCLERLDRVREAADLYMEIGRKEDAAYCYERARDYLRSAYLWIELKRYSVAAKTLNLAGENSLAILSGAMFFFDRGDASRAHQMLSGMTLKGKKLSPDTCLKELLALKTRAFPRPPSPPPQSSSSRIMFGLRSMAAKLLQVIRRVRQVERG